MKIYLSAFLPLLLMLTLAGCGAEQFATSPFTNSSAPSAVSVYQQASCSNHTLIKPEVDILYVVDNSSSKNWIASSVKTAIQNTIGSVSSQFDYRLIGTPLLKTAGGDEGFQVLAKTPSSLPASVGSTRIVSSSANSSFFTTEPADKLDTEMGLKRVQEFITSHQADGLFRQGAYLFIVLVSNGRDMEVEGISNGVHYQIQPAYNNRKAGLLNLKTYLNSQQFRLFSLTANTSCQSGYWASPLSYAAMSQDLYNSHAGFPPKAGADHYDICGSVSQVFADVNSSIQQITIPHSYKYWPITATNSDIDTSPGKVKVYKSSPNSAPVELTSGWSYKLNPNYPNSIETRVDPSTGNEIAGEPTSARHLIEFTSGNYITYPSCVSIKTVSNLEYFGYIVLEKAPKLTDPVPVVKINGTTIPQSSSDGWSYIGMQTRNIKVAYGSYSATPAALRTGYMLQLNGSSNYYKSGDNVEVYYLPSSN